MITIEQLLESVDLDFEPRFVTKDETGVVELWEKKPNKTNYGCWSCYGWQTRLAVLKLAEFDGKHWTECIYEVPLKEEPKDKIKIGTLYIDKSVTFGDGDDDDVGFALEDYEVPRKTDEYEQNLEKLRPADSDLVYRVKLPRKTTRKIEKLKEVSIIRDGDFPSIESTVKVFNRIINRLNELVDAVNELKGAKNE